MIRTTAKNTIEHQGDPAWAREKEFQDPDGKPARLPMTGPGATFSEL